MRLLYCLSFAFVIIVLAAGCDKEVTLNALMIDEATLLPIDSVAMTEEKYDDVTLFSDSTGLVEFGRISGAIEHPDLNVTFTKTGYQTLEMTFPPHETDTLTLFLTPR
jgi:hypothetical protein